MDFLEFGDVGRGCEGENCSRASGLLESCSDQECQWEEGVFGVMELVCVTIIYVPLMLFGLLGNVLTILVVWLRPDMRSSTYLYLSSMAVSDLLILLLLPLDLYKLWRPKPWPLGDFACKLTMFLSECCTFCTILHITFLSLERYLAVCWPITAKTLVTRRRTRAVIGCLWLGAAVSAAPVLIMVGVEEVGGEEQGLGGWSEGGGLSSGEGEHAAFLIGEREREHLASLNGGLVRLEWEEKERWAERVGELKESEGEGEKGSGEEEEKKQGDEGGAEEGKGEESKMKEDEGGGSNGGETDMSECRCTDFAVSSGLLKAMMILSNLYFLIPLCVLALVYSLIGRTLWLRPHSSRRDQSHRHTVKMLGVIVLAFVLCWLPFHVGRTVFSLSLGSDMQETDTNSHSDAPHDVGGGGSINTLAVSHPDSETHLEPVKMTAHAHRQNDLCDVSAGTKVSTDVDGENEIHADMSKHNNTDPPANAHTVNTDLHGDDTHNVTFAHFDAHFYYYLSQYLNLVSSVLFYLSAAVNPLLYNLMSSRYRHAVHSLIHTHCDTHPRRRPAVTAQHSTTTM